MSWNLKIVPFVAAAVLAVSAHAQQVVRIIHGGSPGSPMDILARSIAEPMAPLISRTIIVEAKSGASYTLAADYVAKAAPDGNTILVTFNVHPMSSVTHKNLPYDPVKDFRAVGMIASVPYVIIAHPSVPGANLKETLELAKAQRKTLNFATIGPGTPHHLMMEGVKGQTGADINMVHYKSAVQAQSDVVGGHADLSLLTPSALIESQAKEGRLKVLAVTSSERLPAYPNVATVTEMGYQGFVKNGWYAMMLPAKTPSAVVTAYNEALKKVLATPALQERLRTIGSIPTPSGPEVLDQRIPADSGMWRKIISDNKIVLE